MRPCMLSTSTRALQSLSGTPHFTCFTSTKAQVLAPAESLSARTNPPPPLSSPRQVRLARLVAVLVQKYEYTDICRACQRARVHLHRSRVRDRCHYLHFCTSKASKPSPRQAESRVRDSASCTPRGRRGGANSRAFGGCGGCRARCSGARRVARGRDRRATAAQAGAGAAGGAAAGARAGEPGLKLRVYEALSC
jgi:hypothetical protein